MILGSSMEHPLGSGLAGIGIPDCTLRGQVSHGASALESVSLAVLAGDGDTGDTIGTTGSCSTTTATYPAAEFSPIASTSITPGDSMEPTDFTAEREDSRVTSMDSHRMPRAALIRERSAASIMGQTQEASPPAVSQASVEGFMGAEVSTAAAVTGDSVQLHQTQQMIWRNRLMRTNNINLERLETFTLRLAYGFSSAVLILFLLGLLLVVGFAKSSFAQDAQPKTFASPGEATKALFEATQKQDEQALEAILGAGKEVTSSSDEEEDKLEREQFSQKYQE